MADSPGDVLIGALVAEQSARRDELAAMLVDHVLDQKLTDLVDFERARSIATRALTKSNLERIFERHVIPGYSRYRAATTASAEPVGAFVPDTARDEIIAVIRKSRMPHAKWSEGAIDRALLRRLFAPVWTNLLVSFAKRLPVPGIGGGSGGTGSGPSAVARGVSGIAGRIGRSAKERAEKIVDAGRSVMGGLGTEVERRLQAAAKDFSDGAAEVFREALRDRLKSDEGQELVALITQQMTDHVLITTVAEIHEDAERIPVEEILRLAPSIVAHSAPRAFVQELVRAEIEAFLAHEGKRPLKDLLTELGILDDVRAAVVERTSALARGFFDSLAFRAWLGAVIGA